MQFISEKKSHDSVHMCELKGIKHSAKKKASLPIWKRWFQSHPDRQMDFLFSVSGISSLVTRLPLCCRVVGAKCFCGVTAHGGVQYWLSQELGTRLRDQKSRIKLVK